MSAVPPPVPLDYNPYQAPSAELDLPPPAMVLASRWLRLGAAVLDTLMVFALGVLAAIVLPATQQNQSMMIAFGGLLAVAAIALLVVNIVGIYRSGQTLGKRLLGIRVVRSNGERVDFARYMFLRWMAMGLLGAIPLLGPFITLLDMALIFRDDRKCLHDDFADTIVILL